MILCTGLMYMWKYAIIFDTLPLAQVILSGPVLDFMTAEKDSATIIRVIAGTLHSQVHGCLCYGVLSTHIHTNLASKYFKYITQGLGGVCMRLDARAAAVC